MDAVLLARIQFALTIAFHYLFPPVNIGLALILAIMEGLFLKTRQERFLRLSKFWANIFTLFFVMGVASGVVMEFQFGTNWARFSRYAGAVFASPLAAEGIFAFFLEAGFLGVMLFGWKRVSARMHFVSTLMVALGATLSAFWIIVANSWMQTPAGFRIIGEGVASRVEITDFWAMVLNPSVIDRLTHVLLGCYQAGSFLVIGVSAYHILKRKHRQLAEPAIKIALAVALISSLLQIISGHRSAVSVSRNQPTKLAAFEGHYARYKPAPMFAFGWVDEKSHKTRGFAIPGLLSFLVSGDPKHPVIGLEAFLPEERPPVNITFQAFHIMVAIGLALLLISVLGALFWWRGTLFMRRWLLWIFVGSSVLPPIANELGWVAAEVGRQPWLIYGVLKTSEGISRNVSASMALGSLVIFGALYLMLGCIFLFLLSRTIQCGPVDEAH